MAPNGVVFLDVTVRDTERHVYAGEPGVGVRYVRLELGYPCRPAEVSVFGPRLAIPSGDPLAAIR